MFDCIVAARELLSELTGDIDKAKTREEHVRISARATAAALLVSALEEVTTGDTELPAA